MNTKTTNKEIAVALRKQGKTYNENLAVVPVAKSTLSLWLREVGLSHKQEQRITVRRRRAQLKGAAARKAQRLQRTKEIQTEAETVVKGISKHELFLIGTSLY